MGSAVSQGVGMALGVQSGFNWSAVAMSALGAGVSAGVGHLASGGSLFGANQASMPASSLTAWQLAERAMVSSTISQGVAVAAGMQSRFSWTGVAASGIGAGVGAKVGAEWFPNARDFGERLTRGFVSGAVGSLAASVLAGGKADTVRIATDAFGNALGNSVVEEMRLAGSGAGSTDDQVRKIFRKHTMNDVQWLVAQERMRGLGQYAAIALERTASNDASTLREIGRGPEGETYWNNDAVSYPVKDPHIGVREPLRSVASGAINEDPGYISNINSILTSDLSVGNKVNMAWGMTKYAFRGSSTAQGTVQIIGGGFEVVGAAGLTSSGLGMVAAVPLALHGGDNIGTGFKRVFGDGDGNTLTYKSVYKLTGSRLIAQGVDQGIPFLGGVASLGQGLILAESRVLNTTSYRALNVADAESLEDGMGLMAKAPNGNWSAVEHVMNEGVGRGGAQMNSPWVSTTRDFGVAVEGYNSGHGIVAVNLSRVPAINQIEIWNDLTRSNMYGNSMAYHRAIWGQEVSVFRSISAQAVYSPFAPLGQVQVRPMVIRSLLTGGIGTFRLGEGNL